MTINKFQGKTKEEAIQKAKTEFGENAVIMNVKEVKPKGFFRIFKSTTYEVTAAMEEKEQNVNQTIAMQNMKKLHERINCAADEKIQIPKPEVKTEAEIEAKPEIKPVHMPDFSQLIQQEQKKENEERKIEKRLDDLSDRLEKSLGHAQGGVDIAKEPSAEELNFIRILYSTLLKNEVSEKYVNQILDEVEQFIRPGNSVDMILANVYQKLILRFGQPNLKSWFSLDQLVLEKQLQLQKLLRNIKWIMIKKLPSLPLIHIVLLQRSSCRFMPIFWMHQ